MKNILFFIYSNKTWETIFCRILHWAVVFQETVVQRSNVYGLTQTFVDQRQNDDIQSYTPHFSTMLITLFLMKTGHFSLNSTFKWNQNSSIILIWIEQDDRNVTNHGKIEISLRMRKERIYAEWFCLSFQLIKTKTQNKQFIFSTCINISEICWWGIISDSWK